MTPNQIVADNLRRARDIRRWTQREAAERLEPFLGERWSPVVFSAAERSVKGERIRQFSADHLVAFADGFDFSVAFFLEKSPGVEWVGTPIGTKDIPALRYLELVTGLTPEMAPRPSTALEFRVEARRARKRAELARSGVSGLPYRTEFERERAALHDEALAEVYEKEAQQLGRAETLAEAQRLEQSAADAARSPDRLTTSWPPDESPSSES